MIPYGWFVLPMTTLLALSLSNRHRILNFKCLVIRCMLTGTPTWPLLTVTAPTSALVVVAVAVLAPLTTGCIEGAVLATPLAVVNTWAILYYVCVVVIEIIATYSDIFVTPSKNADKRVQPCL